MQFERPLHQRLLGLDVARVWQAALDGAHRLAGFVIVKAHAFRTKLGIDDVDVVALGDGAVRALGLAGAAVDAIVGDARGHWGDSQCSAGGERRVECRAPMVRAPLVFSVALVAFGAVACGHKIGDDCKTSVDCSQGGERLCDITQPGGYCTVFNCEPNTCPSEAACIVFDPQLSAAKSCESRNGLSRFARSFCLFKCSSNDDCRDDYVCQDFSDPANDWNGLAVDTDRKGKVCVAKRKVQNVSVDDLPSPNVCSGPNGSGGSDGSGGSPNSSGGSSGESGSSGAGGDEASAGGADASAGGAGS